MGFRLMPTELFLVWSLAAWILVVFLTAFLADELGRGGWWLIFAMVLGPVALIALGFSGRGEGHRFRRCPHCLELAARAATICPHCRTALQPVPPPQSGP